MGRMNIKAGAKLHNKHHLVLTDAKTGKVKQEGWAYNAILNQGFNQILNKHITNNVAVQSENGRFFSNSTSYGVAGTTFIGTGTTAVSPTDTTMSSYLDRKTNVFHDNEYDMANLMASHTRKAVWSEAEIQNTVITEVGLGVDSQTSGLVTRALIKDSEGNQVSITKGTLDVLTIYSTFYIELSHAYGNNFKFVEGAPPTPYNAIASNALLRWIAHNCQPVYSGGGDPYVKAFLTYLGKSSDAVLSTDAPVKNLILYKGFHPSDETYGDFAVDVANKRLVLSSQGAGGPLRYGASEGNSTAGIWEIGFSWAFIGSDLATTVQRCSIFRFLTPIAGVWPGTTITDEELGTGDSSNTVFQTTWAPVLSGTDVVKVAGVTQTRNTDYTIDLATGEITFATAPGIGDSVTCTYGIEQIPKDSNHVLDIGFTIQFADGGV